ncbi:hypothetical protein C1752_00214 [Acaryochloris thomasi RCC1774]|uniref:Uncharacterized protein n=1 Tax=Acaryochloris thomasi RCC1774 TaxID=1764569 RepID=A0A2W1JQB7_9CYAN|nr:hypothetical protein C1752_00214 [Acaryochloris thomasi RCC1774]
MAGVLKIEITESEDTLKSLLHQQASARHQEQIHALYWLKSRQVTTRYQ